MSSTDHIWDYVLLSELTEDSVLKHTKSRFDARHVYTYIGDVLVAVNPYQQTPIYGPEFIRRYQSRLLNENPPHIYAIAEESYRAMRQKLKDQCILISGESGAGKTESSKYIIQYLISISEGAKTGSGEAIRNKLLESNTIMEAFGNAKTIRNDNSSRFGKYMEIQFNLLGEPIGGRVTSCLLEKSRVVSREDGEHTFHIFYMIVFGADKNMLESLQLSSDVKDYAYIKQFTASEELKSSYSEQFRHLLNSLSIIGFSAETQLQIFKIIAGILHLGNISFSSEEEKEVGQHNTKVSNQDVLAKAAALLQVKPVDLEKALTQRTVSTKTGKGTEVISNPLNVASALYSRDALAKALYARLFNWLIDAINLKLTSPANTSRLSIGILDIYGFEVFKRNGFEQLCINYCNEALQQLFIELTLKQEQEEYNKEGVSWEAINYFDNQEILDLIENKRKGVFSVLDDTCAIFESTDATFLSRLNTAFPKHNFLDTSATKKDMSLGAVDFRIKHYAGDVIYNTTGFLERNRDILVIDLKKCMWASESELVHTLFPESEFDEKRRPLTTGFQFKGSLNELLLSLRKTEPHYVRCIKPNSAKMKGLFEDSIVAHQIRYLGLTENIRIRQAGYAFRQTFSRFIHRYKSTCPTTWPNWSGDEKSAIVEILRHFDTPVDQYCFGATKVFIKSPTQIVRLEQEREKALHTMQIMMAKTYKGFKARVLRKKLYAVRKLLALYRGYKARVFYRKTRAAILVQKIIRGWLCYKVYESRKASTKIQRAFRKYQHRKYIGHLKYLFSGKLTYENRFGRSILWPKSHSSFSVASDFVQKIYMKYWSQKMSSTLTKDEQAFVAVKVIAYDIFYQKKSWAVSRKYSGNYLQSPSSPHTQEYSELFQKILDATGASKIVYASMAIKYNPRCASETRAMVLTDQAIFKVNPKKFKVQKVGVLIRDLCSISMSPYGDQFVILHFQPPERDMLLDFGNTKETQSEELVSEFVTVLWQLSRAITGRPPVIQFLTETKFNNRRPSSDMVLTFMKGNSTQAQFQKGKDKHVVFCPYP